MLALQANLSINRVKTQEIEVKPLELVTDISHGHDNHSLENNMIETILPIIKSFCRYKIWNSDNAEDFQQDVLEIILRKMRQKEIQKNSSLSEFCRGVCRNHLLSYIRKNKKYSERYCSLEEKCFQDKYQSKAEDVSVGLERNENYKKCRLQMTKLSQQRDRQIILEHLIYDQSPAALSDKFDLTEPHFYRVLHRAKNRLRSLMQDC